MKLIDPRARFGKKGIYGDLKYDLSKLRHSLVGNYDFIVNGFYSLKQHGNNQFELNILENEYNSTLKYYFDEKIKSLNIDPKQICFLEALLFYTMIPLHGDCLQAKMLFTVCDNEI